MTMTCGAEIAEKLARIRQKKMENSNSYLNGRAKNGVCWWGFNVALGEKT